MWIVHRAEGNAWNLNSWRYPAYVSSSGWIYLSYLYSISVTCVFDFTDFPYDVQKCPIVVGDWIYSLRQVNLSMDWDSSPSVRLSWSEMDRGSEKKVHVSGWAIDKTWSQHVYWGPDGVVAGLPSSGLSNAYYWSCMEFWVQLRRHRPYFGVVELLPCLVSSALTLGSFWVDDEAATLLLLLANLVLDALAGWDLAASLPPGNGAVPKIAVFYGFNFSLTLVALIVNVSIHYVLRTLPDMPLPSIAVGLSQRLGAWRGFQSPGLTFDPQEILTAGTPQELDARSTNEEEAETENGEVEAAREEDNLAVDTALMEPMNLCGALFLLRRAVFFSCMFMYLVVALFCIFG